TAAVASASPAVGHSVAPSPSHPVAATAAIIVGARNPKYVVVVLLRLAGRLFPGAARATLVALAYTQELRGALAHDSVRTPAPLARSGGTSIAFARGIPS